MTVFVLFDNKNSIATASHPTTSANRRQRLDNTASTILLEESGTLNVRDIEGSFPRKLSHGWQFPGFSSSEKEFFRTLREWG
jgi:hypothetical protein